jgi:hypothetical protein
VADTLLFRWAVVRAVFVVSEVGLDGRSRRCCCEKGREAELLEIVGRQISGLGRLLDSSAARSQRRPANASRAVATASAATS